MFHFNIIDEDDRVIIVSEGASLQQTAEEVATSGQDDFVSFNLGILAGNCHVVKHSVLPELLVGSFHTFFKLNPTKGIKLNIWPLIDLALILLGFIPLGTSIG